MPPEPIMRPEPLVAEFVEEDAEQTPPDAPEFGHIEQDGDAVVVVLPVPDVHLGMDRIIAEQAEDITDRLRRVLGTTEEEE
jgi:hypothetical protein